MIFIFALNTDGLIKWRFKKSVNSTFTFLLYSRSIQICRGNDCLQIFFRRDRHRQVHIDGYPV